jgi:ribosomal-protein-alanine N-acetyltransferase
LESFTIRLFEQRDLVDVVHINQICLPENYSDSFFLDIYYQFPRSFVVATVNGKVVGYIMCRAEIDFSEMKRFKLGRKGHVISLAVLPQYRGIGIAHSLLSKALENIVEYGAGECYLEVRVGNNVAIDLYKDLNFKVSRIIQGYYRDGEDAYVMNRTLA